MRQRQRLRQHVPVPVRLQFSVAHRRLDDAAPGDHFVATRDTAEAFRHPLSDYVLPITDYAGLDFVERTQHSVNTDGDRRCFELDRDATIEYCYLDLRFRNNDSYPFRRHVTATNDEDYATFQAPVPQRSPSTLPSRSRVPRATCSSQPPTPSSGTNSARPTSGRPSLANEKYSPHACEGTSASRTSGLHERPTRSGTTVGLRLRPNEFHQRRDLYV